jgi:hypothetical protein
MSDVVVTVPKQIWYDWVAEGDSVGVPYSGETWGFFTSGMKPNIALGERVYIVAHGRLRGYAPLTKLVFEPVGGAFGRVAFGRQGGAVAVTIDRPIRGFRGWRYRDWSYEEEKPFPNWQTEGVSLKREG